MRRIIAILLVLLIPITACIAGVFGDPGQGEGTETTVEESTVEISPAPETTAEREETEAPEEVTSQTESPETEETTPAHTEHNYSEFVRVAKTFRDKPGREEAVCETEGCDAKLYRYYWKVTLHVSEDPEQDRLTKAYILYDDESLVFPEPRTGQSEAPFEPTEPHKKNYSFAGWFTDEACTVPYSGTVSGNTELYAKWERILGSLVVHRKAAVCPQSFWYTVEREEEDGSRTLIARVAILSSEFEDGAAELRLVGLPVGDTYVVTEENETWSWRFFHASDPASSVKTVKLTENSTEKIVSFRGKLMIRDWLSAVADRMFKFKQKG